MNIPYVFKKCSKCGRLLVASTDNFSKQKKGKYGIRAVCKECVKIYSKKHYEEYKEENREYAKNYYHKHKEERTNYNKKYNEEHKEELAEYYKEWSKSPQGRISAFNGNNKRRQRTEQQGNGVTKEQWLEMMKYFEFKCAYSGITLNANTRSIDHIVPLAKGGEHEIWNCVPMDRGLNISKNDKDLEEWYPQQDFYDEDRLNKINEWCKYAYNKWGNEVNTKAI